jgi:hypothetical protein
MLRRRAGRIINIGSIVGRPGQLRRRQGRPNRADQDAGPGSRLAQHYRQRHRPRLHCHPDDQRSRRGTTRQTHGRHSTRPPWPAR